MSEALVDDAVHATVMAAADELVARGVCSKRDARDPVNQPAINSWLDAMGDRNPRWKNGEAPPAMAQVWTMYALGEDRDPDDPLHTMMGVLTEAGFTGVLGTNCEQTYERTMRVGELPRREIRLDSVVGPKRTGMGTGYFVTSRTEWFVADELVATMLFRVLKYVPKRPEVEEERSDVTKPKPDAFVLYPTRNRDTEYFWEGTAAGELRIQKCNACGALRHPPGPSCPTCHAFDRGYLVASGTGTVFSHVTHHHPKIPGHTLPLQVALVDLDEGIRMIAGAAESLQIGDRVRIDFRRIDDDLTLPVWRKA